jgi:hypothetical protein
MQSSPNSIDTRPIRVGGDDTNDYGDADDADDVTISKQMIDIDSVNKNGKSSNRRHSNMGNIRSTLDSGAKSLKRSRNKGKSLSKMTASIESVQNIYHEEMSVDK